MIELVGYIDPGSATAIIAMIFGAIAGAGYIKKILDN